MVHYVPHSMPFFLHSMIFIGDFFKPLHKQLPYFIYSCLASHWDFPGSSAGKESACNAGDPSLISGFRKVYWRRDRLPTPVFLGFPGGSAGKESACNAGDPGSVPGSRRSLGEGIGYPLQYSWASLVAQLVKNLPVLQETWVRSLGWEDPLEEGHGYPLQYSCLGNPHGQRSLVGYSSWGHKESDTTERLSTYTPQEAIKPPQTRKYHY